MNRDMRERRSQQGAEQDEREQVVEKYSLDVLVSIVREILVEESRATLRNKGMRIVDVDKALKFLDDIARQLPDDVYEARVICEEREKIIANARKQADEICRDAESRSSVVMENAYKNAQAMVADAKKQAEEIVEEARKQERLLINESQVRVLAEEEAQKLLLDARSKATNEVRNALNYAHELLSGLEAFLASDLQMVRDGLDKLQENGNGNTRRLAERND